MLTYSYMNSSKRPFKQKKLNLRISEPIFCFDLSLESSLRFELKTALHNHAPSLKEVYAWMEEFK